MSSGPKALLLDICRSARLTSSFDISGISTVEYFMAGALTSLGQSVGSVMTYINNHREVQQVVLKHFAAKKYNFFSDLDALFHNCDALKKGGITEKNY